MHLFIDGIKCAPPLVEHQTNYFNQFIKFAAYTHSHIIREVLRFNLINRMEGKPFNQIVYSKA